MISRSRDHIVAPKPFWAAKLTASRGFVAYLGASTLAEHPIPPVRLLGLAHGFPHQRSTISTTTTTTTNTNTNYHWALRSPTARFHHLPPLSIIPEPTS
ncbi:uncharacterized protein PADG_11109 [Paracoccidioides brasiliensis Pb18]|uniref:Uncharacterized protein n=1 Tax=Paracoccidioides brasiliensis (strain Pb18) TaxID=502780 RepID=A0A0A0HX57_PARBD|nr:uncharacterized protein PADG_11109 [Paracoccidioides brasiliensis Pb18]KGM92656.1 hypothetical protein PADG_11109 [Paracoccidioides brasiliensis Pb18]